MMGSMGPALPRQLRRIHAVRRAVCTLGVASLWAACSRGERGVTISGDVAGLDTIGLRGDSLIARAGRPPLGVDLPSTVADQGSRTGAVPQAGASLRAAAPSMPGVNPMTARAHARGDSMAKAFARARAGRVEATGRSRADTVRGVLEMTGVDPARRVVLRSTVGTIVSLSGMATAGMARLVGMEVVIRGVRIAPRDIVVSDFSVRASDGVPAFDGVLSGTPQTGYTLQLTDGTGSKALSELPSPLREVVGARVWIAFKPGATSSRAYGVIGRR